MEYWSVKTSRQEGEVGDRQRVIARQDPDQKITVYIDVPSVDESMAKVKSLGGQVVFPKMAIPGMGYYAVCLNPENNAFGLWENNPQAQ